MNSSAGYLATSSNATGIDDVETLLSHQLRTPLSAIRWMSEMLFDRDLGELTPEQHSYIEQIQSNQQQLAITIGELIENIGSETA